MKYLVVMHGYNEPDNNTPSDDIFVRVENLEPDELAEREKYYHRKWEDEYANGIELDFYPLEELEDGLTKVVEIW